MLDKLVTITLDKERHLRLTLKGMLEFQKITGKNLLKGFSFDQKSLEETAAMIWACLLHEDEELTYDKFQNIIDINNMGEASRAVGEYFNQSLEAVSEVKADKRPLVKKPRAG